MIHFSVHFSLSHTTTLCSQTTKHVSVQFSLFILILCPRGTISSQLSSLLNISIIHSDTLCSHIAWYNYQFLLYCSFWYTVLVAHTNFQFNFYIHSDTLCSSCMIHFSVHFSIFSSDTLCSRSMVHFSVPFYCFVHYSAQFRYLFWYTVLATWYSLSVQLS
jgi:hypothetical protein